MTVVDAEHQLRPLRWRAAWFRCRSTNGRPLPILPIKVPVPDVATGLSLLISAVPAGEAGRCRHRPPPATRRDGHLLVLVDLDAGRRPRLTAGDADVPGDPRALALFAASMARRPRSVSVGACRRATSGHVGASLKKTRAHCARVEAPLAAAGVDDHEELRR